MYVFTYKTIYKTLKKKILLFQGEIKFIPFNTLITSIAKETQSLYLVPALRAGYLAFTLVCEILEVKRCLWKPFQLRSAPTPGCELGQVWQGPRFHLGLFLVENRMSGSAVNLKEDAVVSEEKILRLAGILSVKCHGWTDNLKRQAALLLTVECPGCPGRGSYSCF